MVRIREGDTERIVEYVMETGYGRIHILARCGVVDIVMVIGVCMVRGSVGKVGTRFPQGFSTGYR